MKSFYNFTPGPVWMESNVLAAGSEQLPYFRTMEFSKILLSCEKDILSLVNAPAGSRVIFLTGSGTAGMESCILNLVSDNSYSTVVNGGSFGRRFIEIFERQSKSATEIFCSFGKNLDLCNIEIEQNDFFVINGHETSSGFFYDLNSIGRKCQQNNVNFIVDAISLFLTDKLDMTSYGISALILGSQKALGLYPGLSLIVLNEKMVNKVINRKNKLSSLYFDYSLYLKDGLRGQTPFTPAVGVIHQLRASLDNILKMGLDNYINNVNNLANYFRTSLKKLPVEFVSERMPNCLTALRITDSEMNTDYLVDKLINKYNIYVAPNGGHNMEKIFRVSHMGKQSKKDIDVLIAALEDIFNGL